MISRRRRPRITLPRILLVCGAVLVAAGIFSGDDEPTAAPAVAATGGSVNISLPGQNRAVVSERVGLPVSVAASTPTAAPAATATADNASQPAPNKSATATTPTPKVVADEPAAPGNWTAVEVAPGDSLSLIFSRLKLSKSDLHRIVTSGEDRKLLKRIKPGQIIRFEIIEGRIKTLVVELDQLNSLWVSRDGDSFSHHVETIEPEIRVATATANIRHSLFLDGQRVGLSDQMIMRLTDIFGWDIDFALDLREGDRFSVIFEEIYKDGVMIKQDRLLAAEFINQGKELRAVLFTDESGESEYYAANGDAMRKAFLRTPVNFTRISSRFNLRRKHPILNRIRAHRGVDYAAPLGTPVRATGDGSIHSIGTNGGYGRTIELRHGNSYSTLYAHLSRFARGMKRGKRVRQGQIIGYVGKSGLATGPHLHYEFRISGRHRNPLTVKFPKAESIDKRYLADFKRHAKPYLAQLAQLGTDGQPAAPGIVAQVDTELFAAPAAPESTR